MENSKNGRLVRNSQLYLLQALQSIFQTSSMICLGEQVQLKQARGAARLGAC